MMTSRDPPQAGDEIEAIDLTSIKTSTANVPKVGKGDAPDESGRVPETQTKPVEQRSTFRTVSIMIALFATLFVSALNTTIVATAIPTICADLNSAAGYSWIGASYIIAMTSVVPIWAKVSDIWGRKVVLLTAVALYFASSIICAMSRSMSMLIVGRALQGISGGGIGALINIVISDMFSMRTRPLFLGMLQVTWAVAGGLGPVLGGAFTEFLSWRWIFWINLPISGTAFVLLLLFLDVHNPRTKFTEGVRAVDWAGSLSLIGLMVMVLLGLNFGGTLYPWNSPRVICLVVVGSLMTLIFLFNEGRLANYPIMPLSLFRHRSNAACLALGFTQHFVLTAAEYYLPLYFQSAKSASPLHSGILLLPLVITEAVTAAASGVIIHYSGRYRELIWIGVAVATIGNGLYIRLNATTSLGLIVFFQIVAGSGIGLLFDPPLIALQALVPQDDTATATATRGFMCGIGVAVSIVTGGVIFQNGMLLQGSNLADHGIPADLIDKFSGPEAATHIELIRTISDPAQQLAVKQAFAWSLRNLWITCTCVATIGLFAGALVAKKELTKEHTETRTGIKENTARLHVAIDTLQSAAPPEQPIGESRS